jgi:hypothetical protein
MLELADYFAREVGPGRIVIHQKIGQNDLTAVAGIARENVTRVLNDWQRHKVVSRLSSYYCIENKTQLENHVSDFMQPAPKNARSVFASLRALNSAEAL